MENGILAAFTPATADIDVIHQNDGVVDHGTGQHDEGHHGDDGEITAGHGQNEQGAAESHRQDHHDDDRHQEGLKLGSQNKVHQTQGNDQCQQQVFEALHHIGVAAGDGGVVTFGELVGIQNVIDLSSHAGDVAAEGAAGNGDLAGLIHTMDGLGSLNDLDVGHRAQGNVSAHGCGDRHGAQSVQTVSGCAVAADHNIQRDVVDHYGGGGFTGQGRTDSGADGGSGQAILRSSFPLDGDGDLRDLIGNGTADFNGVGQGADLGSQIIRNHGEGGEVIAGDVHADFAAAHHGGHIGSHDGNFAACNILQQHTQVIRDVLAGTVTIMPAG